MDEATLGIGPITDERSKASRGDAFGWLDGDHISTELGEHLSGELRIRSAEVEHAVGSEHHRHMMTDRALWLHIGLTHLR